MTVESEILDLEREFWSTGGGNPDFWRENFADEGVVVLAMGLMDKAQTVAAMEASDGWEQVEFSDVRLVGAGDDTVVIAYRATARRVGEDQDYQAVISSVYGRRGDRWMLMAHQQTPVD